MTPVIEPRTWSGDLTVNPLTITPWHLWSLAAFEVGAPSSAVYIAANRALYIPFRVPVPFVVSQLFAVNGATVSGNIDVGLYDAAGRRLVSSGSTAQVGTSAAQGFPVSLTLGPGRFFLAVAMDNTTGTLFRSNTNAYVYRAVGCYQQASAFALPATATFATHASQYMPFIGVSGRALL